MEDGKKNQNMEKNSPRKPVSGIFNVGIVLQSLWIRCCSIFPIITNRKFMESEFRLVLYCGAIFWIIYIFSKII